MIGALLLLLITELMNAAIEMTVDRIGTERHELSARPRTWPQQQCWSH